MSKSHLTRFSVPLHLKPHRLPDLDVLVWDSDASDETQPREEQLYKLLDPSYLTLLLVGDPKTSALSPIWNEPLTRWQHILRTKRIAAVPTQPEAKVQFHQDFGSSQSFVLVRPDSYLGFVGN